jgi:hypothetical protein
MYSRVSQVARHLIRPLPHLTHRSAAAFTPRNAMSDNKRLIQTAACLIIGDEVLGGKVRNILRSQMAAWHTSDIQD